MTELTMVDFFQLEFDVAVKMPETVGCSECHGRQVIPDNTPDGENDECWRCAVNGKGTGRIFNTIRNNLLRLVGIWHGEGHQKECICYGTAYYPNTKLAASLDSLGELGEETCVGFVRDVAKIAGTPLDSMHQANGTYRKKRADGSVLEIERPWWASVRGHGYAVGATRLDAAMHAVLNAQAVSF